ncbi:MobC family plasmid mobilization relaxosome protein [uncultured Campylobacter sp.]|uniref:MobC family plasmid mobilization relaxosome protein n=1 Tax=uncultured Campylobacter sp. TaxID=218934 RepID=UPI00261F259B|nr:MobC family plasmid mobilization relaxosome protein [uncultured Campylobacter sp.]
MNHKKFPHKVSVRLSDSEKEKLELNASMSGLNKSSYIRYVLINAKPPIHKFDKTMIIQVAKIGNNLNQIAKHANTHKTIDGIVLKQMLDVNKKLDDLISQKLTREDKYVSKIL